MSMSRTSSAKIGLFGLLTGIPALAALAATGCSSSSSPSSPDAGEDTGILPSPDATAGSDATVPSDATTSTDAGTDGASDGGSGDATCTTTLAAFVGTAGDAGPAGDGGDGATGPQLLFGFDGVTDGVTPPGWYLYSQQTVDASFDSALSASATVGNTCPGSLVLTTSFTAYGDGVTAQYAWGTYGADGGGVGALDWTGRTMLHANVKVVATADMLAQLNGIQLAVQTGGGTYPDYLGDFVGITSFSGGGFVPMTLSLVATSDASTGNGVYDPTKVEQIGVQILSLNAAPEAGVDASTDGGANGPIVVYIDDIWLQ
jgi:hypothetical protein